MKAFSLILSIYILLLVSLPCCIEENCDKIGQTEQSGTSHDDQHNNAACNNCSPFFACGSCQGFVFDFSGFFMEPLPITEEKHKIPFIQNLTNDYIIDIWQPPKIS